MKLNDKVAIVTGASEGIGEAIARRLAAAGARVALAARSEEKLGALASELGAEHALAIPTDVTQPAQVERLVASTVERFGGIDMLVNNAGVGLYGRVEEMDWEQFRRLWEVNFFGVVQLTRVALPHLRARRGAVVNISSVAGKISLPYMGAYCASKFALNALSDSLRMELKAAGVSVTVVCPGRVATRFQRNALRKDENLPKVFRQRDPSGVSAERVARATLRALAGGRRQVVVPWRLRLAIGFRTLLPAALEVVLRRATR